MYVCARVRVHVRASSLIPYSSTLTLCVCVYVFVYVCECV